MGAKKKKRQSFARHISRAGERALEFSEGHFMEVFWRRISNVKEVRIPTLKWVVLVLVLLLLAVAQVYWYSTAFKTDAYIEGGDFHEGSVGRVNSLNPLYAVSDPEKILSKLMFASLVSADGRGALSNELAKSIYQEANGKIWHVRLRDDVYWSDGEKLDVDDVLFTLKLMRDKRVRAVSVTNFANTVIKKEKDNSISFELKAPYANFISSLNFAILPEHILANVEPGKIYEHDFSKHPIGSGAFKLKTQKKTSRGQIVYLDRNENYFKGRTKIASFTLSAYADSKDVSKEIESGILLGATDLKRMGVEPNLRLVNKRSVGLNGGSYLFLNTQRELLRNLEARRAIQRGINMQTVRSGIVDDWALDYPILERQAKGLVQPKVPEFNREEAWSNLEKIGILHRKDKLLDANGKQVELKMVVQKRPILVEVAERCASELRKLGFNVILEQYDVGSQASEDFFTAVIQPRNYDILVQEIAMGMDADPFPYYASTQASYNGMNLSNYKNVVADGILTSARAIIDPDLRKSKYDDFMHLWVNEVPAIGIYQSFMDYYYAKNVRIFSEDALLASSVDRFYDIRDWGVVESQKMQSP